MYFLFGISCKISWYKNKGTKKKTERFYILHKRVNVGTF